MKGECQPAINRYEHRQVSAPFSTQQRYADYFDVPLELLKSEGADLRRVCIGHMDRNPDLWLYEQILRHGVFLGLDQVSKVILHGTDPHHPDHGSGAPRIWAAHPLGGDLARRCYLTAFGGGPEFAHIPAWFILHLERQMLEEGVTHRETGQAARDLMVNNPRDFLALEQREGRLWQM